MSMGILTGGLPESLPPILPAAESERTSGPAATARAKDPSVETLRGLAILLMVMGHVVGDTGTSGLRVEDDSLYRYCYFSTQYLRMPLFTVISGFVYAMRPVVPGGSVRFLKGKLRRIMLPLVSVATLQYLLRGFIPGVNHPAQLNEFWKIYAYGIDQFWFLQALLVVFLTVAVLEELEALSTLAGWLLSFGGAVVASHFLPKPDLFSLWGYLYLLPYFLLGCGLHRFGEVLSRRPFVTVAALLLAAAIAVQQATWFSGRGAGGELYGWLSLAVGISGTLLLFRFRPSIPALARLGTYSFSIYLFHVFPAAGSRILLIRCGLQQRETLFMAGLLCGIAAPVVIEIALRRHPLLRLAMLGQR